MGSALRVWAEAVSGGWASRVGQPVGGMPVVLVGRDEGKVEGAARDWALAQRRALDSGTRAGLAPPSAAPWAAARVCPMGERVGGGRDHEFAGWLGVAVGDAAPEEPHVW